jgi:hypothetical protein
MPRKKLSADEHKRRGTFQPVRHGDQAALLGIDEDDPSTWFIHHTPREQWFWARYLEAYIPGARVPCYHYINWLSVVEASAYWRKQRGDLGYPESPEARAHSAAKLARLLAETQPRRRR